MGVPVSAAIFNDVPINTIVRVMPTKDGLPILSASGLTDDGHSLLYKGQPVGGGGSVSLPAPLLLAEPDGSLVYILDFAPTLPANSFYFVNGIKWKFATHYTISGNRMSFLPAARFIPNVGDFHELYAS